MSLEESPGSDQAQTAGQCLRRAREERGMSLEALASGMKVPLWQLQALEADDWVALKSGPALIRALAASVCRALRIESHLVMSLLPEASQSVSVSAAPRPRTQARIMAYGHPPMPRSASSVRRLWVLVLAVLIFSLATAIGYWGAEGWISGFRSTGFWFDTRPVAAMEVSTSTEEAPAGIPGLAASVPDAGVLVPEVLSQASEAQPSLSPVSSSPHVKWANELVFSATSQASWIEVRDQAGVVISSGLLPVGQSVRVGHAGPMVVVVGNPEFVQVNHQSKALDLSRFTRFKVARFEVNP